MPDRYNTWYQLFRRGRTLAAEVTASDPARRSWLIVRPLDGERFHLLYYEVEEQFVEAMQQTWDYDEFVLNRQNLYVQGEKELEIALARWLDDWGQLVDRGLSGSPL